MRPAATLDPGRERVFRYILFAFILAILIGGPVLLVKSFKKLTGKGINRRAWLASFSERRLTVPPEGKPREGFWGVKLAPVPDPDLGFILPKRHIPGVFEIDRWGRQYAFSSRRPQ
ncbi:MAG: hypothetical protein A2992_08295 [Elusimicrobia bacterium RIFCSPLOWO2_01_FULL_59_12]|nr:MAG: hypothetical protein A2992_08295 [Elusimicrobia bacterium RIFCSPLOWO2_01_FULL_59_12]